MYRDVALTQAQFYETPAHVLGNYQAQVRFAAKARVPGRRGAAHRASPSAWTRLPQTQDHARRAGQLLRDGRGPGRSPRRARVCATSAASSIPTRRISTRTTGCRPTYYQTMLTYLRELCGGGCSSCRPRTGLSETRRSRPTSSATSARPGSTSVERVKLYKLAWDLVGSEFAGRHQQYELFYAGGAGPDDLRSRLPRLRLRRARAPWSSGVSPATTPARPAGERSGAMTATRRGSSTELRKRQSGPDRALPRLVRIPSENPPGDTSRHRRLHRALSRARAGCARQSTSRAGACPTSSPASGAGAPNLVLSGHLDEFPAGAGWTLSAVLGPGARTAAIWGAARATCKGDSPSRSSSWAWCARRAAPLGGYADPGLRLRRGDGRRVGHAVAPRKREGGAGRRVPDRRVLGHVVGRHRREGRAVAARAGERACRATRRTPAGTARCAKVRGAARSRAARAPGGRPRSGAAVDRGDSAPPPSATGDAGTGRLAERVTVNVGTIRGGGR